MDNIELFALEHLDTGVLISNKQVIHYTNPSFDKIFQTTGKLNGKSLESLYGSLLGKTLIECAKENKQYDGTVKINNTRNPLKVIVRDDYLCCYLSHGDTNQITDNKKYETNLSEHTSRLFWLESIEDTSKVVASVLEYYSGMKDFKRLYISKTALLYWGRTESELLNTFIYQDNKLVSLLRTTDIFARAFHFETIDRVEAKNYEIYTTDHLRFNNKEMTVVVKLKFLGFSENKNPVILQILESMTERFDIEKQLEIKQRCLTDISELNSRLTWLCDNAPILMAIVRVVLDESEQGSDMLILYCNLEAKRSFRKEGKDITNVLISDCGFSFDEINGWVNNYCKQAKEEHRPISFESIYDGTPHYTTIKYIRDDEYLYMSQDITAVKQLEEVLKNNQIQLEETVKARTKQLQEALTVKSRFLAIMSHEMRTPLSGIMGSIQLLCDTVLTIEQESLVHTIQVCGEQLLVVINDILDLTKMQENKMVLDKIPSTLQRIIEESIEIVSFHAVQKGIKLVYKTEPNVPSMFLVDASRLRQIFVNLLSNSVKFSNEGDISISTRLVSTVNKKGTDYCTLEFSVKDNGVGIPDDIKQHIFSPFFQAEVPSNRRTPGSGLGLSIAKRLTELMDGTMWFESKENVGSTFYFTTVLPVYKQQGENRGDKKTDTYDGTVDKNIRILIAEDNPMNQIVIQKLLKNIGFSNFRLVDNGQKAVEAAKLENFDVVLMDCMMPIMSGIEATEHIRKELKAEQQPTIIALTADAFKENATNCRAAGMDGFLTKPIKKEDLISSLSKIKKL